MREEVSNELAEVINEYGPQMFDDFNEVRRTCLYVAHTLTSLVVAHSCALFHCTAVFWPARHLASEERHRRCGCTGQFARTPYGQSSVQSYASPPHSLPHSSPKTWLDERLFGWTRSATRGTSAWAGTRSQEISRAATPDVSDEEDAPDYDDILAVPSGDGHSLSTRPRSQRSSYADIQRLRRSSSTANTNGGMLSPLSPTVAASATATGEKHTDTDGLHFRGGQQQTRTRKASLSDSVPVEVIGEVDRGEPFKEATKDLNTEMKKRRDSQDEGKPEPPPAPKPEE